MTAPRPAAAALIAVDWGTTNRRGYLLDKDGELLDARADGLGLVNVEQGGFEAAYAVLAARWLDAHGPIPALLSGMAGASTGWKEARYCQLPVGLDDLAGALVQVPSRYRVWIIPGLTTRDRMGIPDVMRGEEIQALAVAQSHPHCLIVLPGTHSKWVRVEDGRVTGFRSYMTGDLHSAILNHTVASVLAEGAGQDDRPAFLAGVELGYANSTDLTHLVFGARTRVLAGELAGQGVSDYLSGLLIGVEIASGLACNGESDPVITLVGDPRLCALYRQAFTRVGADAIEASAVMSGRAYVRLAERAGLITTSCRG